MNERLRNSSNWIYANVRNVWLYLNCSQSFNRIQLLCYAYLLCTLFCNALQRMWCYIWKAFHCVSLCVFMHVYLSLFPPLATCITPFDRFTFGWNVSQRRHTPCIVCTVLRGGTKNMNGRQSTKIPPIANRNADGSAYFPDCLFGLFHDCVVMKRCLPFTRTHTHT